MSTFVELEIQNLLNENGDEPPSLRSVGERLVQAVESSPDNFTLDNINALARFLVNARQPDILTQFVLRYIENQSFPIPWPYFLEALSMLSGRFDEKVLAALRHGLEEDDAQAEASRATSFTELPELAEWRSERKYKIHKEYSNNRSALLDQLITLRTQQLYEEEKNLLARLQKLYPGDSQIQLEASEHKQRYALEILQRRAPKARTIKAQDYIPPDPELDAVLENVLLSLHEQAEQNPSMALDFAIAAYMWESYDAALSLLSFYEEESAALLWLRLEILLKCRRYVELLNEIARVEILFADDPETFFATAYLRAQAFWGLGQKHTAIEVMEGLMASRPHYRAAAALLSIWSGQ